MNEQRLHQALVLRKTAFATTANPETLRSIEDEAMSTGITEAVGDRQGLALCGEPRRVQPSAAQRAHLTRRPVRSPGCQRVGVRPSLSLTAEASMTRLRCNTMTLSPLSKRRLLHMYLDRTGAARCSKELATYFPHAPRAQRRTPIARYLARRHTPTAQPARVSYPATRTVPGYASRGVVPHRAFLSAGGPSAPDCGSREQSRPLARHAWPRHSHRTPSESVTHAQRSTVG